MKRGPRGVWRWVVVTLALSAQASCDEAPEGVFPAPTGRVDHHMHLASETAAAHLDRVRLALGEGSADDPPSRPTTAADAVAALDTAGMARGLVLSNGYMFGMPEAEVEGEAESVRAENDFVIEQASLYPDRLVPLCSVNPLKDYAAAEVDRCGADLRVGGLKLHLANSDVDLLNAEHVEVLAALVERAAGAGLPLVVHMRTRNPDYGEQDANAFIDHVLVRAGEVPVQIAHMAGWGGYDDATDAALSAFVDALQEGRLDGVRITFGLGAVVFSPSAAGADTARANGVREANARLAERIRTLGPERVVFATDWPSWPPVEDRLQGIARNVELVRAALPLSPEEMTRVLDNVGPILDWRR